MEVGAESRFRTDASDVIASTDFKNSWGYGSPICPGDGDAPGDGVIDIADLIALLSAWGQCEP